MVIIRVPDFELIAQTGVANQPGESQKWSNLGFAVFEDPAVSDPSTYKQFHVSFGLFGQSIEP